MKPGRIPLILLVGAVVAVPLAGVQTAFWQTGTFDELLRGTLRGVTLSEGGELQLAPEPLSVFNPEEAMALSIASDSHHNVYIGTGNQGKVFRVDQNLKGSLLFKAPEPEIFALAVGPDGDLYAGSSPEGKIYRLTQDGKSSVFADPKVKYIWALAFDREGRLYAGTGDHGLILRYDSSGKSEVFFDSKQTHIMCLAFDEAGNLLAGSATNGLLYRINPQGKAFVIYKANLPEIHDVALDSQGRIDVAALGSATGIGIPQIFMQPNLGAPTATVTSVTVQASTGAEEPQASKSQAPAHPGTPAPSFNHPTTMPAGFGIQQLPKGKGSLVQILPDNSIETLWSSNEESIFGLAVHHDDILFSTDSGGKIFDLSPSQNSQDLKLLTETHESMATRLLYRDSDLYIATSNIAKLIRLGSTPGREGTYESPVKDTKFVSHWGVIAWRGETPEGTSLEFFSRSGNSERPDETWSDWDGPYKDANGSPIKSPNARYIQWKAVFQGSGETTPTLGDVTVSYLNQNLAPEIHSLTVSPGGERSGPTAMPMPSGIPSSGTITITSGTTMNFGSSYGGASSKTPVTLTWQADDPNGDTLVYSLYVKSEDEQEWHLVKDRLQVPTYTLEPDTLADGQYVAKLVASDEDSNPPALARKAELESAPFWIDNTPPEVRVVSQTITSAGAVVHFAVETQISPLRSAQASTDGKNWNDVLSDDGVIDSRAETFTVRTGKLGPGEHIITLRAFDTAGNAGIGKAVVRVPEGGAPGK